MPFVVLWFDRRRQPAAGEEEEDSCGENIKCGAIGENGEKMQRRRRGGRPKRIDLRAVRDMVGKQPASRSSERRLE